MGWTSDEDGDTSAHASESDSLEDIPPLKKARYVWQIKGKYHLKEPEEKRDIIREGPVHCKCNEFASTSKEVTVSRQPAARIAAAHLDSFTKTEPINMLQQSAQKSWQLHRWQARQVARCFVDNTINRVLEDMGLVPLAPGNAPPPSLLEEGTEQSSMDSREGHNVLEDEAVLMAIHSYGLQRASALSRHRHRQALPVNMVASDVLLRPSTQSQQQCHSRADPVRTASSDGLQQASALSQQQCHIQAVPVRTASSDGLQTASALSQRQHHIQAVHVDTAPSETVVAEHGDFLDAAVAVAIEKKGLGTLSSAITTGASGDNG